MDSQTGEQKKSTGKSDQKKTDSKNPFDSGKDSKEFDKQSFLAKMRKESRQKKSEGVKGVAKATSKTSEDVHGGDEATKDIKDSPNAANNGKSPDNKGAEIGQGGDNGSSNQAQSPGLKNPAKEQNASKTIVNTATLARILASGDPTAQFRTAEGIKTAAEIAQELAQSQGNKIDLQSLDGSFQAKVRGGKAIIEAQPEVTKQIAELDKPSMETGKATSGGMLGGKGDSLPEFTGNWGSDISPELIKIMPLLRGLSGEKRIELMEKWTQIPVKQRVRGGPEYRLLKGIAHLEALKAISQFEEIEDGEQTMSKAGERVDLLRGIHYDAPLDELRTIEEAMSQGGAVDDEAEIREKRVSTDAPNLMFLFDTSGSMGYEGRMQSAMAAGQATAAYYGPKGATFGLTAFADHPARLVPPPEQDIDVVIDGILMLEPGNGTSYARGLELAIRQSLPNTTIMVFGDFLDSGFPSPEIYAIAHDKNVKVVGIVSAAGNPDYAAEICDETYTVSSWDNPSAVALAALKAAQ